MNVSCSRCQKVLELEVMIDGVPSDGEEISIEVVDCRGLVLFACTDCMSDREVWMKACQSAVVLLEASEESIAMLEMVFERIPATTDDSEFKANYAEAQKQAALARETLATLLAHEPQDS